MAPPNPCISTLTRHERVQLSLDNPRFEGGQLASLPGDRHQSAFFRWFVERFNTTLLSLFNGEASGNSGGFSRFQLELIQIEPIADR